MTPATAWAVPHVRATGRHHGGHRPLWPARALRSLKQRLIEHNDRMIRDMARELEERAQIRKNARALAELLQEPSWQGDVARISLLVTGICVGVVI